MVQPTPTWQVIYEDRDVLVVRKGAGLLTSTVPRERRPTLLAAVRVYVGEREPRARVGLIHRLDRDAQGLLVFSKSHEAYQSLKSQFFHHTVDREYTVMVEGTLSPPKGTVTSRLVERADGTVYSTRREGAGQIAVTDYEVVGKKAGRSVVRAKLQTGRKHQLRVHMSDRGAAVVGDRMYGKADAAGLRLAATRLAFDHPRSGERMEFKLPPPAWMK